VNKYRNRATTIDNHRFASLREAARYRELALLLAAGEIRNLELQVRFPLLVNGVKICTYIADFCYFSKDGKYTVEDSKGYATPLYKLKRRLMAACHNIDVEEV